MSVSQQLLDRHSRGDEDSYAYGEHQVLEGEDLHRVAAATGEEDSLGNVDLQAPGRGPRQLKGEGPVRG